MKFEPESDLIFEIKTGTKVCIREELDLKLDSQFHLCVNLEPEARFFEFFFGKKD
jgi:hypothetical protein